MLSCCLVSILHFTDIYIRIVDFKEILTTEKFRLHVLKQQMLHTQSKK